MSQRKVAAPFKPRIRDELDVSNFAEEFTDMVPTYSPAAAPKTADRIFKVRSNYVIILSVPSLVHHKVKTHLTWHLSELV